MTKNRGSNEGSIWKDGDKYRAAFSSDGARKTKSFATKAECKDWLMVMRREKDSGVNLRMGSIPFEDFIHNWLDIHNVELREKTKIQYIGLVNHYILPEMGKWKLANIKTIHIDSFYHNLQKQGVSDRLVRYIHSILHSCFNYAVEREIIGRNPTHHAKKPKKNRDAQEMHILDKEQVKKFLNVVQGNRYEALYYLAIKTGMRQGELLGLFWEDFDEDNCSIHIQRQAQAIHGKGILFSSPKTKAGRRTIQLGNNTLEVLRSHRKRQEHEKLFAGDRWKENGLIFPSSCGTPVHQTNLLKDFNNQLKKAELAHIRFHDLRHTAASLMLNNRIPVIVVSKILGHSKPSITIDIYGHLDKGIQDEAARIMDDLIP